MFRQLVLVILFHLLNACAVATSSHDQGNVLEDQDQKNHSHDHVLNLTHTDLQQLESDSKGDMARLENWIKQAESGDAEAHYNLGLYYAEQGKLQDAELNLEKAANDGVTAALYALASLYTDKATLMYDIQKSYRWALAGAKANDANSMVLLYQIMPMLQTLEQSSFSNLDWLKRASTLGHPEAQYKLGELYEVGIEDMPRNISRARHLYEKSAQQDHAEAQFKLGMMYYHGQVLNPDYSQAFAYFLKAAKQNHAAAQYQIGAMYYTGQVSGIADASLPRWYQGYIGRHHLHQHTSVINRNKMAYLWFGLANERDHEEAEQMQLIVAHILDKDQIETLSVLIEGWSALSSK